MRYLKNQPLISQEKQEILGEKKIAIIGLGGLGGYLAHGALRFGIRNLYLIDGDVFSMSNLNRQLFCTEESIGRLKVDCVKEALLAIDSRAKIETHAVFLKDVHESRWFKDVDLLLDGLDNIPDRHLLQQISLQLQVPLIHGALDGFVGQYAFLEPDHDHMKKIYAGSSALRGSGNFSFVASLVASYQLLLMAQFFLEDPELPRNQLFRLDLREQEQINIPL